MRIIHICDSKNRRKKTANDIHKGISQSERIITFFIFFLTDNCNHLLSKTNTWFFKEMTYDILLLFYYYYYYYSFFWNEKDPVCFGEKRSMLRSNAHAPLDLESAKWFKARIQTVTGAELKVRFAAGDLKK